MSMTSGYDALDELYERLREAEETQHAQRAGEITPETIRAARGGVADENGRIPATAAESAAHADSVPLVDISRDTRERIEADAWEAARLDMSRTWEQRRDAIVALLDRQAALTERETKLRELYKFEENHRDHIRSIEEVNRQLNERIAELQAELDEYDQTHMALPVDADGVPVRVGDKLRGVYETFEVCAVSEHYAYWEQGRHWDRANECHHVGPRTLEDVLWDYRCGEITREGAAAEIRGLLGSDGE